ncbi:MAG: site-2 protease family protein [Nanoarchaeota archaeon]|nr:site-2 protease family protein [DPANN group archaeon]MBL7116332.1 site-2 protease family protein [Nanoarchaeota archaeon]
MSFLSFVIEYKFVILFYVLIIAIVVVNKKKFDFQAKFIALYRTQVGIKLMHKFSDWLGGFIRGFGYVGIFIGYAGMVLILYFILEGFYKLIFVPEAPATLAPVIPGVPIPGSPIFVPFWYGITALFVVVAVHEFCHGIVSAAHNIKVKNSGIVFFGPLIGAFVEPDEKELKKKSWWAQESLFAAGPVANGVLSVVVMLLLLFLLFPMMSSFVTPTGFFFEDVTEDYPALAAGVQPKTVYSTINNVPVNNASYLNELLNNIKPGDPVVIGNENLTHTVITTEHPDKPEKAFLGIIGLQSKHALKDSAQQWKFDVLTVISKFLQWVFILSLGIGLANLLPLGPVDGGRMLHLTLKKWFGEKRAMVVFSKITVLLLALIIILVIVPIFKAVI